MRAIAVTRTYLELRRPDHLRGSGVLPPGITLARETCAPALYRRLYAGVGRAYHWRDRDAWSDDTLAAHLARPEVGVWVLRDAGAPVGYFELVAQDDRSVEIAYFGLAASHHGRGLGQVLLVRAATEAWAQGATRVWLHTCTLDHPAALPNYVARGFRPFRVESYVVELPDA
ncbi:MAG TPA: GNAT family N-acetyltransferase [Gemmatimonadaceae bacterium]|nr:GNAT family N-acetyltransferase [Gemmatimonadaceae bacterium]